MRAECARREGRRRRRWQRSGLERERGQATQAAKHKSAVTRSRAAADGEGEGMPRARQGETDADWWGKRAGGRRWTGKDGREHVAEPAGDPHIAPQIAGC